MSFFFELSIPSQRSVTAAPFLVVLLAHVVMLYAPCGLALVTDALAGAFFLGNVIVEAKLEEIVIGRKGHGKEE
jgi:hypothetical protein